MQTLRRQYDSLTRKEQQDFLSWQAGRLQQLRAKQERNHRIAVAINETEQCVDESGQSLL